jgi:hypothetical protein
MVYFIYLICLIFFIVEKYKKTILFSLFSTQRKVPIEVSFINITDVWSSDFFLLTLVGFIPLILYAKLTFLWEFSSSIFWFEKKWGITHLSSSLITLIITLLTAIKARSQLICYFGYFMSNETIYFSPQLNSLLSQLIFLWLLLVLMSVWLREFTFVLSFLYPVIIGTQCIIYLAVGNLKIKSLKTLSNQTPATHSNSLP